MGRTKGLRIRSGRSTPQQLPTEFRPRPGITIARARQTPVPSAPPKVERRFSSCMLSPHLFGYAYADFRTEAIQRALGTLRLVRCANLPAVQDQPVTDVGPRLLAATAPSGRARPCADPYACSTPAGASRPTCVSTTMPGTANALPRMTLAVLRPMPGRFTNSSSVPGTLPPCSLTMAWQQARMLRALLRKKLMLRIASCSSSGVASAKAWASA